MSYSVHGLMSSFIELHRLVGEKCLYQFHADSIPSEQTTSDQKSIQITALSTGNLQILIDLHRVVSEECHGSSK